MVEVVVEVIVMTRLFSLAAALFCSLGWGLPGPWSNASLAHGAVSSQEPPIATPPAPQEVFPAPAPSPTPSPPPAIIDEASVTPLITTAIKEQGFSPVDLKVKLSVNASDPKKATATTRFVDIGLNGARISSFECAVSVTTIPAPPPPTDPEEVPLEPATGELTVSIKTCTTLDKPENQIWKTFPILFGTLEEHAKEISIRETLLAQQAVAEAARKKQAERLETILAEETVARLGDFETLAKRFEALKLPPDRFQGFLFFETALASTLYNPLQDPRTHFTCMPIDPSHPLALHRVAGTFKPESSARYALKRYSYEMAVLGPAAQEAFGSLPNEGQDHVHLVARVYKRADCQQDPIDFGFFSVGADDARRNLFLNEWAKVLNKPPIRKPTGTASAGTISDDLRLRALLDLLGFAPTNMNVSKKTERGLWGWGDTTDVLVVSFAPLAIDTKTTPHEALASPKPYTVTCEIASLSYESPFQTVDVRRCELRHRVVGRQEDETLSTSSESSSRLTPDSVRTVLSVTPVDRPDLVPHLAGMLNLVGNIDAAECQKGEPGLDGFTSFDPNTVDRVTPIAEKEGFQVIKLTGSVEKRVRALDAIASGTPDPTDAYDYFFVRTFFYDDSCSLAVLEGVQFARRPR